MFPSMEPAAPSTELRTGFKHRRLRPLGLPGVFRRDEQAGIVSRLQQITDIPRTAIISVAIGLLQAEAEAEWGGGRDGDRVLPFANLSGKLSQRRRVALHNSMRGPQSV